jgi:hypothetical protein
MGEGKEEVVKIEGRLERALAIRQSGEHVNC